MVLGILGKIKAQDMFSKNSTKISRKLQQQKLDENQTPYPKKEFYTTLPIHTHVRPPYKQLSCLEYLLHSSPFAR